MRFFSQLMIFIALFIQLGHDVIPHYHDHSHSDLAHHHHAHPIVPIGDNESPDENAFDFTDVLPFLLHDSDGFNYLSLGSNDFFKRTFSLDICLPIGYSFCEEFLLIKQNAPPYHSAFIHLFQIRKAALRGPPLSIA